MTDYNRRPTHGIVYDLPL